MIDALLAKEMRLQFNIVGTLGAKYSFKDVLLAPVQLAAMQLHPGATRKDVQIKVRNYLKNSVDSEHRRVKRASDKAGNELLDAVAADEPDMDVV